MGATWQPPPLTLVNKTFSLSFQVSPEHIAWGQHGVHGVAREGCTFAVAGVVVSVVQKGSVAESASDTTAVVESSLRAV